MPSRQADKAQFDVARPNDTTVAPEHLARPLSAWAFKHLLRIAFERVEHGFHAPSRTHISFCLVIGKVGIRGVGATPSDAFAEYKKCAHQVLSSAEEPELAHWLVRCEKIAPPSPIRKSNSTAGGLTGQIGMRLPVLAYERLERAAREKSQRSWNAFVASRLAQAAKTFDEMAEKKASSKIKMDIERLLQADDAKSDKHETELKSWSQRVDAPLHAKLLSLAHEFGYSVARFSIYLLLIDGADERRAKKIGGE